MAIKIGTDGTLYCNTVRYNYKQARNLIADGSYGNISGCWSFQNVSATSAVSGYKTYRCFQHNIDTAGETIQTQTAFAPTAEHKYYGGMMWKTDVSSFTGRSILQWRCGNGDGKRRDFFDISNTTTNGNWVKLSGIVQWNTVDEGDWTFRAVMVNPSAVSYCCKLMIIDLTDTFGAGNEPDKAWCDVNIREWEVITNYGCVSNNVNTSNLTSRYPIVNATAGHFNYLQLNSRWEPRDYMFMLNGLESALEGYIYSSVAFELNKDTMYYASMDYHRPKASTATEQSIDFYWPEAEPPLGIVGIVQNREFCNGGGMEEWKRASAYNNRTTFANGAYALRYDFNNRNQTTDFRVTGINLQKVQSNLNIYNSFNNTSITINDVNKEWCDRWIDGRSSPIIHIKDPNNTRILFNTDYDIICNDIEIRPELNNVQLDKDTGTIYCKKLVKTQNY